MILDSLTVDSEQFAHRTGWEAKPEGLCKGELCYPAPDALTDDGEIDVRAVADRLGMPIVSDPDSGLYALGPESGGTALSTVEVPPLELPDVDGARFDLGSLRGRKVLLVAWASW